MRQNSDLEKTDLADLINSKIDTLFTPKTTIEIDPATGEVKNPLADHKKDEGILAEDQNIEGQSQENPIRPEAPIEKESTPAAEIKPKPEEKEQQTIEALDRLIQSYLGLEWEIKEKGLNEAKHLLDLIANALEEEENSSCGKVITLMRRTISEIAESPHNVPTFAFKVLIRCATLTSKKIQNKDRDTIDQIESEINEVIADLERLKLAQTKQAQEEISEASPSEPSAPLNAPQKNMEPESSCEVDSAPGPESPSALVQEKGKESLTEKICNDFSNDIKPGIEVEIEPPENRELTPTLPSENKEFIEGHLSLLDNFLKRLNAIENSLAKYPDITKIIIAHKSLSQQLDIQRDKLKNTFYSSDSKTTDTFNAVIEEHLDELNKVIKRLATLETLFSGMPGFLELGSAYKKLKKLLVEQTKQLQQYFKITDKRSDQDKGLDLFTVGQIQLYTLEHAIKRILSIEQVLKKNKNCSKLSAFQEEIRTQLDFQRKIIAEALKYPVQMHSIAEVKAGCDEQAEKISSPCPWDRLLIGYWKGKPFAFVPKQIAYEGPIYCGATIKVLKDQNVFPLKKLVSWPWQKIAPLVKGELAVLQEEDLRHLSLPLLTYPHPLQQLRAIDKNNILLILFSHKKGGVLVLDNPCAETDVSRSIWTPSKDPTSLFAGSITTCDGKTVQVITVENIYRN